MLTVLKELPQMNMDTSETGCCPKFEPEKWDGMLFELEGLQMVKATTGKSLNGYHSSKPPSNQKVKQ